MKPDAPSLIETWSTSRKTFVTILCGFPSFNNILKGKSMTKSKDTIHLPAHLPRKLSISCWIWSWITSATKGEPYYDLERCMIELKERGFNSIRVEAGLNWAFTLEGKPRGQIEVAAPMLGAYTASMAVATIKEGVTYNFIL